MMGIGRMWIVAIGIVAAGCGGGMMGRSASTMPQGGNFSGVWFSQQYGEMHIVQNGAAIQGRYFKDERKGTITGECDGDLIEFEWIEKKAMVANRPNESRGHGYFRYVITETGEHRLEGEWGIDGNDSGGGPWTSYKMKNRVPEIGSGGSGGGSSGYDDDGYDDSDDDEDSDDDDSDYM